ncbi:hypothetical protein C1645_730880 [Glomus cerebriforme]|uniref:F-box domain-containing protein n=1 Tax=Glomus cerebriforme TaxID=658196 RepID=A0A397TSI7_9GLOM|nr:hypothetical protein C1645_730880 [Glomus cerebriforme]
MFKEINNNTQDNLLKQEIYKLFVSQCENIKTLLWSTLQPLSLFPGAQTCFSQLYRLCVEVDFVNSDALDEMARICKGLNELTIRYCSYDHPGLISLINAQKNLKRVWLHFTIKKGCKELGKSLARKGDTIDVLTLYSVSVITPSLLTSFINLKYLSIYNKTNKENVEDEVKELQQYLAISEFSKLQSLNIYELSCFKELATLVEKAKENILQIFIYNSDYNTNKDAENTEMLIKAISNNCPNIKQLSTYIEPKDFIHIKSLLLNCRSLRKIRLDNLNSFVNENDNIGDELLDILTKFSPKSLNDVTISEVWKYSIDAFEQFFESCRERTTINFGIIHDDKYFITEDHKSIVRKYMNKGVIEWTNCVLTS